MLLRALQWEAKTHKRQMAEPLLASGLPILSFNACAAYTV